MGCLTHAQLVYPEKGGWSLLQSGLQSTKQVTTSSLVVTFNVIIIIANDNGAHTMGQILCFTLYMHHLVENLQ